MQPTLKIWTLSKAGLVLTVSICGHLLSTGRPAPRSPESETVKTMGPGQKVPMVALGSEDTKAPGHTPGEQAQGTPGQ